MLFEISIFFITTLISVYLYSIYLHSYWRRNGVPFLRPSFLFGNVKNIFLFRKGTTEHFNDMYQTEEFKDEPIIGIYMGYKPALLIRDPELIKKILIRDFNKFSNRFSQPSKELDPMAAHNLFFLRSAEWKNMRNKLTPVFTSGKMKQMFQLVESIGNELNDHICNLTVTENTAEVELKGLSALYTTDVIASIAFGIDANTIKNPKGEFRVAGASIFHFNTWHATEFNLIFFLPKLVELFRSRIFNQEATNFLRSTVNYAMFERKTPRNDLIDVLIKLREDSMNDSNDNMKFRGDTLFAQAAVFFAAGFETSSATMSFALYELSKNLSIQNQLREEIKNVLSANNGKCTYENINEMTYLNMVVQETLRLYPPLGYLERVCTLEDNETDFSLKPFSDFKIPNGMPVFVVPFGLQRDSKYFKNPDKFDPERFNVTNKNEINPSTYMPFGLGPHNCIGERFGLIQSKIGLISVLRNHKIVPSKKSLKTMKFEGKAFLTQAKGGIFCDLQRDLLI